MRAFRTALIILSAVLTVTVGNRIYVNNRMDEMLDVCAKIKHSSSAPLIDELASRWQHCSDIISLTTSLSDIERAENAILSLGHYPHGSADYNAQLSLLVSILGHIKLSHSISLSGIF